MKNDEHIKTIWKNINKNLEEIGINQKINAIQTYLPDKVAELYKLQERIDEKWVAYREGFSVDSALSMADFDLTRPKLEEKDKGPVDLIMDWWCGWVDLVAECKNL